MLIRQPLTAQPWRVSVGAGLAAWAASRLVVTTIAMVTLWLNTGTVFGGRRATDLLSRWDSEHFADIVSYGYFGNDDPTAPAFFPGYPYLSRGVAALLSAATPVATSWSMFIVAAVAGVFACVMLFRLADAVAGHRVAVAAVMLLAFGPYAVFLHASYSESLFLALAITAWYLGLTERWWWAGLVTAAASATRPNGLFLFAALAVMYVVRRRAAGQRIIAPPVIGVLLGVLGTAGYFGYLWARTGHPDEWWRAQRAGWYRQTHTPWDALVNTVHEVQTHVKDQAQAQFALDIVFAALMLAAVVWLFHRRDWAALTFVVLTLGSLVTSTTWVSLARASLTLFPITVIVARGSVRDGWRYWLFLAVLVGSGLLLWFNTQQFVLGRWAD